MSESKVTKENMLFHLKHGCSFYPVCPICNAILALIEHGPEVSRELVEKYANRISIATTWNGQNVRILKRAFREAGVTVKEKK